MADATKLPLSSEMFIGQWSRKDEPQPKLSSPLGAALTDDTVVVTVPFKDRTGTIVTGGFLMGVRKANGWTETIWVPVGSGSADGLTFSNVIRGVDPSGTDYTTGDANFADEHLTGEPVYCNIPVFLPEMMRSVLQGLIASGGSDFIIGTDAAGTVTISRSSGVGTWLGFLRWFTTSGKAEFSNDGAVWTAIDDASASVIFKISSADTTAGYAEDKIQAGTDITITKQNTGANEYLEISTSLPDVIDSHEVYTPAFLTGGSNAETNISLWDSVGDGSFRQTIDGVAYNFDGIDFTATGPLGIVTSMDDVAAVIQYYIRALTGSLETCVWSTDHLIISSVDTTSSSAITVTETSTGTVGTDISGAGASDWMDCDTGNGTVTNKVLDATADVGKVVKTDATGNLPPLLMPSNLQGIADTGTTDATGTEIETLTDGSDASALHTHSGSDPQESWKTITIPLIAEDGTSIWDENDISSPPVRTMDNGNASIKSSSAGSASNFILLAYASANSTSGLRFDDFSAGQKLIFEIPFYPTGKTSVDYRFGLGDNSGGTGDASGSAALKFLLSYNGASALTASAYHNDDSGAGTSTSITVSDDTVMNMFRIEWTPGTNAVFKINDSIVATVTTDIPTVSHAQNINAFVGVNATGASMTGTFGNQPYIAIQRP
jgi:hypothetical protein